MSLVSGVLASIKQRQGIETKSIGGDGLSVEVAELSKRAGEAKVAVIQSLQSQYSDLSSALQDATMLQSNVSLNLQQLELLQCSLGEEVQSAVAESVNAVRSVAASWKEAVIGLKLAQELLAVHEQLKAAGEHSTMGQYLSAAKCLKKAEELLEVVDPEVEVLSAIIEEIIVRRAELVFNLSKAWQDSYSWEEHYDQNKKQKMFTLVITHPSTLGEVDSTIPTAGDAPDPALADASEVLGALSMLQELDSRFNTLANNIYNNFLRVAVTRSAKVSFQQGSSSYSVSITFSTQSDSISLMPQEVFMNVQKILKSLLEAAFAVEFEHIKSTEASDCGKATLMQLLGEKVGEQFTTLLIKDCLASAVPYSRKNLSDFDAIKAATHEFHTSLVTLGFYKDSEVSILDYAANVDTVFSAKSCSKLLDTARTLVSQPLHNTVTISPDDGGYPPLTMQDILCKDEHGVSMDKSALRLEKVLAPKSFHMPRCQVSKSIVELQDLVYDTMEEACNSSPQYAGKLVYTVRNMLSVYEHVTPVVHADTLNTIPQHAALVHNNSMFISTHCYLLAHQYRSRLPEGLRDADPASTSYTDLAYQITQMGSQVFCKAMLCHKKELLDTIAQAQGPREVPRETGIKQCLMQLQQLKNVWSDVLPHSVYNKAMGTLLNSVIKEVIERTLSLEDISEDSALSLSSSLHILKDKANSLFPHTPSSLDSPGPVKEGVCGVRQWGRFLELLVVLSASLKELENRWSDGKGPLALYFTPDQAKTLIRALFQNTERRAQLLARIKLQ